MQNDIYPGGQQPLTAPSRHRPGLALVKKLTEVLGGRVYGESELGKGSRFVVILPWQQPAKKTAAFP